MPKEKKKKRKESAYAKKVKYRKNNFGTLHIKVPTKTGIEAKDVTYPRPLFEHIPFVLEPDRIKGKHLVREK